MRETNFIKQNKEKWIEFEKQLAQNNNDPEKLSDLFVQVTDDLSYSRTFYKNRSVRVYLNNISQKVFQNIYRNRSRKKNRFSFFWKQELPQLAWETRKDLSLSAIIFFLAVFIGIFSCLVNPQFPSFILGEGYIQMTLENIQKGDPMGVYKNTTQGTMFLEITYNNVLVAVMTFMFGAFLGIGTIGSLIYNGIMVGAIEYFFYQHGVLAKSMTAMWLHGTLEISAIIIAGGAGLAMGRGLVLPGTLSRMQSFRLSSRRGLKIMLGLIPIFFFAAFIESFITRYYNSVPTWVDVMLIFISLFFIIGYFVVLPYLRSRKGFEDATEDGKLPPTASDKVDLTVIRTNGELFKDTFIIYGKAFKRLLPLAIVLASVYAVMVALFYSDIIELQFNLNYYSIFDLIGKVFVFYHDIFQFFFYYETSQFVLVNLFIFSFIAFICCTYVLKEADRDLNTRSRKFILQNFYRPLLVGLLITAIMFMPDAWGLFFVSTLLPIFILWMIIMFKENMNPFTALGRAFSYGFGSFGRVYGLYLICILVGFLFMAVVTSPWLTWRFFEIITWNIKLDAEGYQKFFLGFFTFLGMCGLSLLMPVMVLGYGIQYHTLKEINEANNLKERINHIGERKKAKSIDLD